MALPFLSSPCSLRWLFLVGPESSPHLGHLPVSAVAPWMPEARAPLAGGISRCTLDWLLILHTRLWNLYILAYGIRYPAGPRFPVGKSVIRRYFSFFRGDAPASAPLASTTGVLRMSKYDTRYMRSPATSASCSFSCPLLAELCFPWIVQLPSARVPASSSPPIPQLLCDELPALPWSWPVAEFLWERPVWCRACRSILSTPC
jgi:hypothetical protein